MREVYLRKLSEIFGKQSKNKWQWEEDKYEISVHLSDPDDKKFQEQLDIFALFKSRPEVLKDYEKLKNSMNGKSYKEYQIAKYEFYNKVLGL